MNTVVEAHVSNEALMTLFVQFLCLELDIRPGSISVAPYEIDDGNYGICIDDTDSDFVIFVKESGRNVGEIFTTVAHEMVHVKQYMKENLGWFLDNRSYIPYRERWWEQEAYAKAVPLVEKFAQGYIK